ncbi:MAG TPA: 30S ribosomal protein S17 [Longimicrobiales bacterium]|nr:30S ribosomal protein S17 [Longimicrobiales bacterium]
MEQNEGPGRKARQGTVVSDRMDKTVVVAVVRRTAHPLYGKMIKRTKRYSAHDEQNEARVGDIVRIVETRPLSRTKRWRVAEVLERAE